MTGIIEIKKTFIENVEDLARIEADIQAGRILFVETNRFFAKFDENILVLKQTFEKLHRICAACGGSMGRIGDDILVLSPNSHIIL
jgi:SepF-like predicted cell division protein (DUF552 family)